MLFVKTLHEFLISPKDEKIKIFENAFPPPPVGPVS
jgi:hypothetical protein